MVWISSFWVADWGYEKWEQRIPSMSIRSIFECSAEFSTFPNEAFAKFMGGYQRLKEGSTAWALSAMTGDPTRSGVARAALSHGPKAVHSNDVANPSHPGRIFVRSENGMWTRKELEDWGRKT